MFLKVVESHDYDELTLLHKLQCCFAGGMSLQHSLTEPLLGAERRRGKQRNLCGVKKRVEL